MRHIDVPYFGIIDPFSVEEEYVGELGLRDVAVMLNLNFEAHWISPDKLHAVTDLLNNVAAIDDRNRQHLCKQYMKADSNTVRYYLEFMQEKIWRSALELLVDFSDQSIPPREQLLHKMHLTSVGFYPDKQDGFAVFDYSIGYDYTEYFLALNLNEEGALQEITMEL
jgi:hypothetical protein